MRISRHQRNTRPALRWPAAGREGDAIPQLFAPKPAEGTCAPIRRAARPRWHPAAEQRASGGPPRCSLPNRPALCSRTQRRRAARRQAGCPRVGRPNRSTAARSDAGHSWRESFRDGSRAHLPEPPPNRGQPDASEALAFTGDSPSRASEGAKRNPCISTCSARCTGRDRGRRPRYRAPGRQQCAPSPSTEDQPSSWDRRPGCRARGQPRY
jgi:hypothetical protein